MVPASIVRYTESRQAFFCRPLFRHTAGVPGQTIGMPKNEIRQVVAQNLRDAMERAGMNQTDLAKKAGISGSHLSEILRQLASVTVDLVADLAKALGVEPWELLVNGEQAKKVAWARVVGYTESPRKPAK